MYVFDVTRNFNFFWILSVIKQGLRPMLSTGLLDHGFDWWEVKLNVTFALEELCAVNQ